MSTVAASCISFCDAMQPTELKPFLGSHAKPRAHQVREAAFLIDNSQLPGNRGRQRVKPSSFGARLCVPKLVEPY